MMYAMLILGKLIEFIRKIAFEILKNKHMVELNRKNSILKKINI